MFRRIPLQFVLQMCKLFWQTNLPWDSKQLTTKKREELAKEIENIASNIVIMRVQPCRIDDMRAKGINLDKIEAMKKQYNLSFYEAGMVARQDEVKHIAKLLKQLPKIYTKEEIETILQGLFKIERIRQDHCFMWNVPMYKLGKFELEPWFASMNETMRQAVREYLGWHLLVKARKL